ncbi:butyrate kinase [Sporohalobacter salinus]|nr:butyrate kinase [Sporohalobacter salinus]
MAVFSGKSEAWSDLIEHTSEDLKGFERIVDQLDWRRQLIVNAVKEEDFSLENFAAIVARGGLLDPIPGGTYRIDETMIDDLRTGKNGEHASNLAGIIAYNLAREKGISAFTVDPIGVDEFEPLARLSGLPELQRRCQSHALNLKAIARKTADTLGTELEKVNLIGAHLGGGFSIAAMKQGRIVDVNNANQGGPYSPERVGTLPILDLVEYVYQSDLDLQSLKKRLIGKGGLAAYLGTTDGRKIEKMIENGNKKAELVYEGMIYQIAKEISAMAGVLSGKVDGIFLTGGLAHSIYVMHGVKKRVKFLAPVRIYPGAEELRHLAYGALRVLQGVEEAKDYDEERRKLDAQQFQSIN